MIKLITYLTSLSITYCFSSILSVISISDIAKAEVYILVLAVLYVITLACRSGYFFLRQYFEKNVRVELKKEVIG